MMAIPVAIIRKALSLPSLFETIAAIRAMVAPKERPSPDALPGQLGLWVVDAEGLPPRPWHIQPGATIQCKALGCSLTAGECVTRQRATDGQRTRDTWRGQGATYPTCVTKTCAQGRGIREALDAPEPLSLRTRPTFGGDPGGFRPGASMSVPAAKRRLRAVGLLDEVRTLDADDAPVGE